MAEPSSLLLNKIYCLFPLAVNEDPAEAITTQPTAAHSVNERCSFRNTNAAKEAIAGSKLINMLNVLAGNCFKAPISKVKGIALESKASAAPSPSNLGFNPDKPPLKIPNGKMIIVAKSIPTATASPPFIILDILPPRIMYAAQNTPASKASKTPEIFNPLLDHGAIKAIPTIDNVTQIKSITLFELKMASTNGPINSSVTPKPIGIRDMDK